MTNDTINYTIKKSSILFVLAIALIGFAGCDTSKLNVDSPPTGIIQNLQQGSVLSRAVKMLIMTQAFDETADNKIERVLVSVNGNAVGEATRLTYGLKPTFSYTWNTMNDYPDGTYNVQAELLDTKGSRGLTDVYTVTLENGKNDGPQVAIANVVNGQELSGNSGILVEPMANQAALKEVSLLVDGVTIARDAAAPYSFVINPTLVTTGIHALQAKGLGTDGKIRLSSAINVVVTGGL